MSTVFGEPCARAVDEAGKRLGQFRDQRLAGRRRQAIAREQRLADGSEMAEARNDAVERDRRNLGAVRFSISTRQASGRSDLRRLPRTPRMAAARDWRSRLASPCGPPVATASTRSASTSKGECCKHPARDLRLVDGECEDHRPAAQAR